MVGSDRALGFQQPEQLGSFRLHELDRAASFDIQANQRFGIGGAQVEAPIRKFEGNAIGAIECQGVRRVSPIGMARIGLAATCMTDSESIERLPSDEYATLENIVLPRLALHAREASAPAKLLHAIEHLGAAR